MQEKISEKKKMFRLFAKFIEAIDGCNVFFVILLLAKCGDDDGLLAPIFEMYVKATPLNRCMCTCSNELDIITV